MSVFEELKKIIVEIKDIPKIRLLWNPALQTIWKLTHWTSWKC